MQFFLKKYIYIGLILNSIKKINFKMPIAKIAPSMLSSDFASLAVEAHRMVKNGADWLHMGTLEIRILVNCLYY